jgi:hypothetical protein
MLGHAYHMVSSPRGTAARSSSLDAWALAPARDVEDDAALVEGLARHLQAAGVRSSGAAAHDKAGTQD